MPKINPLLVFLASIFVSLSASTKEIRTNSLIVYNLPNWVKKNRVERITEKLESRLEWKIRRVAVYFHNSENSFKKAHTLGSRPAAVTIKSPKKTEVHISPRAKDNNFDKIFGHELVHVIFYQKYKGSIPRWLEEGFANFYSRSEKVNYPWLNKQKKFSDVTKMGHPFHPSSIPIAVHYKTSQAVVEMLDERCDLSNLLRLSVEKKLVDFIRRTCQIHDINRAYSQYLLEQNRKVNN